jgi:hypothetical protein
MPDICVGLEVLSTVVMKTFNTIHDALSQKIELLILVFSGCCLLSKSLKIKHKIILSVFFLYGSSMWCLTLLKKENYVGLIYKCTKKIHMKLYESNKD